MSMMDRKTLCNKKQGIIRLKMSVMHRLRKLALHQIDKISIFQRMYIVLPASKTAKQWKR